MRRTPRFLLVFAMILSVIAMTACTAPTATPTPSTAPTAEPTATPTAVPEPTATPTPDAGALFLADAQAAQATLESSMTLYLDFCKSVESAWYDALSKGKNGLTAAKAYVALAASQATIAQFQAYLDQLDAKVAAWKSLEIPDTMSAIPGKVDAILAALKAMKTYMTTPSGTMSSYTKAYDAAYDKTDALYNDLIDSPAALG